jgi:hypothetical protein
MGLGIVQCILLDGFKALGKGLAEFFEFLVGVHRSHFTGFYQEGKRKKEGGTKNMPAEEHPSYSYPTVLTLQDSGM